MSRSRSGPATPLKGLVFWRKWHRWISFAGALFLLWAAVTGFLLAFDEFFGQDEARREAVRRLVSPVTTTSDSRAWTAAVSAALATVAKQTGSAPVDSVTISLKGTPPTVTVFVGKPQGGEDRKFVVDASTGELLEVDAYVDKPFLNRLHSGEAFGDGGLVLAMFWALTLVVITASGLVIYFMLRPKRRRGLQNVFW